MFKLSHLSPAWLAEHDPDELRKPGAVGGGEWVEHSHPPIFTRRKYSDGTVSIVATAPAGDAVIFRRLVEGLQPPYMLLYLLHTPRGEAEPGRYLSESLEKPKVLQIIDRFAEFLGGDARHDFWRHNLIHAVH